MLKLSVDIDTTSSERWDFLFFSTKIPVPYINKKSDGFSFCFLLSPDWKRLLLHCVLLRNT